MARLTLKITALQSFLPSDITRGHDMHTPEAFFRCLTVRRDSKDENTGDSCKTVISVVV